MLKIQSIFLFFFEIYLEGKRIHSVENLKPLLYKSVALFAGNSFNMAANGKIRNLIFMNGKNFPGKCYCSYTCFLI